MSSKQFTSKVWEKLAKSLAAALALVALWGIAAPRRAGATIVSQAIHYAKYRGWWFLGVLRRLLAGILLLCLSASPALAARPFSRSDLAWQAAATLSLAADWAQSRDIARHPGMFEVNPVIGPHPSAARINTYFIVSALLDAGIARLLPSRWRRAWQVGTIGVEVLQVRNNAAIGLQVRF